MPSDDAGQNTVVLGFSRRRPEFLIEIEATTAIDWQGRKMWEAINVQ